MITFFRDWMHNHFSDPQMIILIVLLLAALLLLLLFGKMLTPLLIAVVLAYVLDGPVSALERHRCPHLLAVIFVFISFLAIVLTLLIVLLPMAFRQIGQLLEELPSMISSLQHSIMQLSDRYPDVISRDQIRQLLVSLSSQLTDLGQRLLSFSISSVKNVITFFVYLIIVPFLIFFFLKDKRLIKVWTSRFLPENRSLASGVWREVDQQISNYIRGKIWEILIVAVGSYIVFILLGLRYALIIALFTGLSVLMPYIGATVMFFPPTLIALIQWGFSGNSISVIIAYLIIQALDGNLLAPLLLSEVVDLHPVAIIAAVLVFGGLWGFWGLFFAIPLATLVQAVIKAWFDTIERRKQMAAEQKSAV